MELLTSSRSRCFRAHRHGAKTKPKIRIIHIFAPEIIKTDAANFRELVQRLTGKPAAEDMIATKRREPPTRVLRATKRTRGAAVPERVKEEMWAESCFLASFPDGFMENLDGFPFVEGSVHVPTGGF